MVDRLPARSEAVCPKSWGLLCTKIINRAIFACFAPRKQVRVCKFHSFGGIFCFLLYTRAQKTRKSHPLARGMAPQVGEHGGQSGGGSTHGGGGGGNPTASGEPTQRCFTLGPTATHDARRLPCALLPSNRDGRRMAFEPNRFFLHIIHKRQVLHTLKRPQHLAQTKTIRYICKNISTQPTMLHAALVHYFIKKTVSWKVYSLFTASLPPS